MKHEIPFECGDHHKEAALDRVTWMNEGRHGGGDIGGGSFMLSKPNWEKLEENGLIRYNNRRGPMIPLDQLLDDLDAIESALYLLGISVECKTCAKGDPVLRLQGLRMPGGWTDAGRCDLAALRFMVERRICKIHKPRRQRIIRKAVHWHDVRKNEYGWRPPAEYLVHETEDCDLGPNAGEWISGGGWEIERVWCVNPKIPKGRFRDALMALGFERDSKPIE